MEHKYKRLSKNTILLFIGKAGSSIIGLLLLPFYTKYLSTAEYGTYDLINTYALILLGFVGCCISDSLFVYSKNESEENRSYYFSSGLIFFIFSSLLYSILIYFIVNIGKNFSYKNVFFDEIIWIFLLMLSYFVQYYTQSFCQSIDKIKTYSITGLIQTITLTSCSLFLVPNYKLEGYLYSVVISNIITSLYTIIASKSYIYFSIKKIKLSYIKKLLSYGIPLIPNGIMWWLVNGLNRPVMETYLGLSALGLYAVANKFPSLLSFLFNIFGNALGISVLEEFNKDSFNKFFNNIFKISFFIMFILGILISSLSKFILQIFASPEYIDGWKLIPILTLAALLQNYSGMLGNIFMAIKKSKYFFYSSLYGGAVSILATFVFVKYWGIYGAAFAVVASFMAMFIIRLKYSWKYINMFNIKYYAFSLLLYIIFILSIILITDLLTRIIISSIIVIIFIVLNIDFIVSIKSILFSFTKKAK